MPGSQEASLDEDAVFLPVKPSSPEFLYSELERHSMEKLLCEGPKSFYNCVGAELSGSFLSPDEMCPLRVWRWAGLRRLGCAWKTLRSTRIPPPRDNLPSERSSGGIIVTDRLTDSTIIGDLHDAASRGVPVYIILNQRTVEEKYTLHRLGHPNIQVRVLGGKSFCSSKGKMMVGELKDKFILVDLETVIHGSYSLAWTDAHLHRHLITVVTGSVVDSFDKEFRTLFAESAPVPNLLQYAVPHVEMTEQQNDFKDPSPPRHFHVTQEILNPPSPPMDTHLDWEAMGVITRESFPDSLLEDTEIEEKETPLHTDVKFDKNTLVLDTYTQNGFHPMTMRRVWDSSPMINSMPDNAKISNWAEHQTEQAASQQFSTEDRALSAWRDNRDSDLRQNEFLFSSMRERRRARPDPNVKEESGFDDLSSGIENIAASRKPLILRVPQSESFHSLNDLIKRFKPQNNRGELFRKGSSTNMSEMTQSMVDLHTDAPSADPTPDERRFSVPRLNSNYHDEDQMTPGLILMKRRNNVIKSALQRIPQASKPRPRSFALDLSWRPLRERKGEEE